MDRCERYIICEREKGNQYKSEILLIYHRRVITKDGRFYESSRHFVKI